MLMGNENWPELLALTSLFSVELPGNSMIFVLIAGSRAGH
jgi:hypothetical protein